MRPKTTITLNLDVSDLGEGLPLNLRDLLRQEAQAVMAKALNRRWLERQLLRIRIEAEKKRREEFDAAIKMQRKAAKQADQRGNDKNGCAA